MSSMRVVFSDVTENLWVPALVAVSELVAGNEKPIGALCEQDIPPRQIYYDVIHDELLEPGWETFFSSILVRIAKILTPVIPEQLVVLPSKMLGSAWHWLITTHQSINRQRSRGQNYNDSTFSDFFDLFIKKPTDLYLRICGIAQKKCKFLRYGITQFGIFSLAGLALKFAPEENLPGVNINSDDPFSKNLTKTILYSLVEQVTYCTSQVMRFCIDFKEEFGKGKTLVAKALANVINERLLPGHSLSAVAGCVSTYYLGQKIPKTTAALIGEFSFKIFNRVANCHRRRATKYVIENEKDENGNITGSRYKLKDSKKIPHYRFNGSNVFNKFLAGCDFICNPWRTFFVRGVSKVFNVPLKDLEKSYTVSLKSTKTNLKQTETPLPPSKQAA